MKIDIDPHAGFCHGVARAIEKAEMKLALSNSLHCLGEIVHNPEEIGRLSVLGLKTVDKDEFDKLKDTTVLIRAHGEPPETYRKAKKNNIVLVEATCPVVLNLQKKVHQEWLNMKSEGGTVIIAGKKDHPEVMGLAGQTQYEAILVESLEDLKRINLAGPVRVFAQTTFNKDEYEIIRSRIKAMVQRYDSDPGRYKSYNSICGQVSNRIPDLKDFCRSHDVIIFICGKNSSNGKNLFEICKSVNPLSYHISAAKELKASWKKGAKNIGISGATSTPRWLMEDVAKKISGL
jgi:4-hydroxy-3-methylbut-2-enyl diphosphate reductase